MTHDLPHHIVDVVVVFVETQDFQGHLDLGMVVYVVRVALDDRLDIFNVGSANRASLLSLEAGDPILEMGEAFGDIAVILAGRAARQHGGRRSLVVEGLAAKATDPILLAHDIFVCRTPLAPAVGDGAGVGGGRVGEHDDIDLGDDGVGRDIGD
jgi:hypothetical protein